MCLWDSSNFLKLAFKEVEEMAKTQGGSRFTGSGSPLAPFSKASDVVAALRFTVLHEQKLVAANAATHGDQALQIVTPGFEELEDRFGLGYLEG